MFSTYKKDFKVKYAGLINALNNTFGNIEVKKDFFTLDNIVHLEKDFVLGSNHLKLLFHVTDNKHKCDGIKYGIDFDYFIHNKIPEKKDTLNLIKKYYYDLNSKIDFSDIATQSTQSNRFTSPSSEYHYIKYLNHLSVKNHLLSKYYKGSGLLGDEGRDYLFNLLGKTITTSKHRNELHISTLENNGTIYDALGKPNGLVSYGWYDNPNNQNSYLNNYFFDIYSDILYGYKHKSNFVLSIKIKNKDSVLYENHILLDTINEKKIQLTDYDSVKKNIDTFLKNFEQTKTHNSLSKNYNTTSIVKELTGKTFLKEKNNKIMKSENKTDFSSLGHIDLILLVNEFMVNKFNNEILIFESSGFGVNVVDTDKHILKPDDLVRLITQMKQTEKILKNCLPDFLEKTTKEESKLLLSKSWDSQIKEAMRSSLEKFIVRNKIKLK